MKTYAEMTQAERVAWAQRAFESNASVYAYFQVNRNNPAFLELCDKSPQMRREIAEAEKIIQEVRTCIDDGIPLEGMPIFLYKTINEMKGNLTRRLDYLADSKRFTIKELITQGHDLSARIAISDAEAREFVNHLFRTEREFNVLRNKFESFSDNLDYALEKVGSAVEDIRSVEEKNLAAKVELETSKRNF